ncbi:acetyl-coenzyme A synthetase N-terminal domain-containing protein, partial [Paracoccus sp. (in: a-proteobacteria)]|uniref:acetyl-coenzyme A synthetase N-terminal domain-containing protein n=1 Tax=Paracoccus sp. TaxID=267 RepID=UPI003A84D47F
MGYSETYARWRSDPEAFWMEAAGSIDWVRPPSKALWDENAPLYEWYSDGLVNGCWNAVDRHVEAGHGD